jgi:uncharacterized protein (TIGR03083 family)
MGMTDDPRPLPETLDDLAAYAADALDAAEAAGVAARIEDDPAAAGWAGDLRAAAGEYAAAVVVAEPPAAGVRSRALTAAQRRRAPVPPDAAASPIEVHRVELSRAVLLLCDLAPDDWSRPVDPPELDGWTVHDLAVHLVANESLLAANLGVPVPGMPERATDNEGRAAEAQARHRGLPPHQAIAELEAAAEAADAAVIARGDARLDEPIDWWGGRTATGIALMIRAFETWTHADDIRRVVGAEPVAPPPSSLLTMTHAACGFVTSLLAVRGAYHPGRFVRFRFDDLGVAWDIDLGVVGGVVPATDEDADVDAAITTAALDFCRAVSARLPASGLPHRVEGDATLAAEIVAALPALAVV